MTTHDKTVYIGRLNGEQYTKCELYGLIGRYGDSITRKWDTSSVEFAWRVNVKKKKIYLPSESHIKLNQINAKGGLPEEQTLINAGRPYNLTIV